jgi:lysyl-tRNA synthetase class 2
VEGLEILTPCLVNLPDSKTGLSDPELRVAKRHLDLLANQESRAVFRTRSRIISCIRRFLDEREFMEAETPILAKQAGGAIARPFCTSKALANGSQEPLVLRIAPELYLKRLLVGGFDRVYELGRQFRNEGVDATHNPEFTSCEFYAAYTSIEETQKMVEELLRQLAELTGKLDAFKGFRCIDVVRELRQCHGIAIDPSDPESLLSESVLRHLSFTKATAPSPAKVFDRLVGKYIEPLSHDRPTFLYRPPLFTSPLARADAEDPSLAARFELFYRGHELVNAYQELTDPFEQHRRFLAQQATKTAAGASTASDEALEIPDGDEEFVDALECAMPPATGCGIGIDRLIMILCGRSHIRDVILFPY